MSRFYSALKEASRPQQANSPEQEWPASDAANTDPLPVPNIDISALMMPEAPPAVSEPSSTQDGDIAERVSEAAPMPELLQEELLEAALSGAPQSHALTHDGSFGTQTHALVDQKARLIPHAADPAVVEHYRRLRTKILQQRETKPFRTLVVASPGPQEGKTVTVLNLGLSLAMIPSFKVLVVDGDLRRGSLGKWLGVEDQAGLSDLIEGSATLEDVVLKCDEMPVHFMVRGNGKVSAGELLHSPHMGRHFRRMGEYFDMVLVDSPPVNLINDAQLLAAACDGVLLIARAYSTTRKSLEKAARDLQPFRVIGTVLNGGTRAQLYRRRSNGYY